MGTQLPYVPTRGEVRALLARPPAHTLVGIRNRAVMEAMYRAGLRVSEVVNLLDRDVDFDRDMLMLRHTKRGKSRNVPFDERLRAWLLAWRDLRDRSGIVSPSGYFFCNWKGGRLWKHYIWQFVVRYAEEARLPIGDRDAGRDGMHPHTLRHAYATELLSEGFNLVEIAALLGHSSVKTTERYTHIMPQHLANKIRMRLKDQADPYAVDREEVGPGANELAELLARDK